MVKYQSCIKCKVSPVNENFIFITAGYLLVLHLHVGVMIINVANALQSVS